LELWNRSSGRNYTNRKWTYCKS